MKKSLFLSAVLLLVTLSAWAQGSRLDTPLAPFTSLRLSGKMNVTLVKADENSLTATFNNVDPNRLEYTMKKGALTVKLKPVSNKTDFSADVTLYYTHLGEITIDGATVVNEGVIDDKILNLQLSAGATVSLNLDTDDITVNAGGNSRITLSGEAEIFTAKTGMGGRINAVALDCLYANVHTTMGGECYVWATRRLEARAATNSNIYYKGTPEILKISTNTMGNIMAIADASADELPGEGETGQQ